MIDFLIFLLMLFVGVIALVVLFGAVAFAVNLDDCFCTCCGQQIDWGD